MRRIFNICFIAVLALASSCVKSLEDGTGYLVATASINDATIKVEATTKASDHAFAVEVKDAEGSLLGSFTLAPGAQSTPMELRRGVYSVSASMGEDVEAAFDSPYYFGQGQFIVKSAEKTNVALECSLANDRVTVEVSDDVRASFPAFSVKVRNQQPKETASLQYTYNEIDAQAQGYLKCRGALYIDLAATNKDGDNFSTSFVVENVEPRTHFTLKFDVENPFSKDGLGVFNLVVDRTYTDILEDINSDLSSSEISITEASGADLALPLHCVEGAAEKGLFEITSPYGFQKIYLIHNDAAFTSKGFARKHNLLVSAPENVLVTSSQGELAKVQVDLRQFFAGLALGDYSFRLAAIDGRCNFAEATVSVTVGAATAVATKALTATCYTITATGIYYPEERPAGINFRYKEATASEWATYEGDINFEGNLFTAKITGLKDNTQYQVMAVTATEEVPATALSVKTDIAEQPYNFGFDEWWKDGKAWYPNLDKAHHYWDTANAGATLLGGDSSTYPDENHAVKGKSCCMQSIALVGVFAGGNVYSGKFVDRQGTTALLDQGQPFTRRPKALKGYYDYAPVTINKTKDPYSSLNGKMDQALIYAYLTDWSGPHRVKSGDESTYVNLDNDPSIIGIAQLVVSQNTNGQFVAFVQDFEYRNDKTPTYLVVTCTSSRYADYFTGGVGSKLWIDEFEFIYE